MNLIKDILRSGYYGARAVEKVTNIRNKRNMK